VRGQGLNVEYNPVQTFLVEAEELIADIEQSVLSLTADDPETIHRLFRAFHTIKGSGAMCGLTNVSGFTHHVETLLDQMRGGKVPATANLTDLLLAAADQIRRLLAAEQGGAPVDPKSSQDLVEKIQQASSMAPSQPLEDRSQPAETGETAQAQRQIWKISFRPSPSLLVSGGNPMLLFRDLRRLGDCEVSAQTEDIPKLGDLQPELCYLSWKMTLQTTSKENAVRDVFVFVENDSELEIELVETGFPLTSASHERESATVPQAPQQQRSVTKESSVRVPSGRLDRLVNLVGELVMNQSCLAQAATRTGAAEFVNSVQELERLVAELRDTVLGIRMLPIGSLFGRFRRLVHDLSAELGKEVDLVTEGEETELDKSILDQLGDPLVHCLRNSVDHAVEPAAERIANGKPGRATIRLTAEHTGSDVVVSIQDDGRGINRVAVRAKAIEQHLIAPDANLSEKDIYNLVLMPGFSTAKRVTNVSGRGVGMDAVKRQIDALRGSLTLASEEGRGTRVAITLPLTLAIIEGLLVQMGSDHFIIPMAAVTENVELPRAQRARNNGRNLIAVRGDLIPYIDLREAFRICGDSPAVEKVVIVRYEEHRVGLVVDRVLGTHQTVLQSLGRFLRHINVVSGATILGDGRVALIMDIAAVVRHADKQCRVLSLDLA